MTLEQIRAALPTHIMLTENVHIWQPNVRGLFYGHSRRFRTKDDAENAIEFFGGQNRIIKELEVGRLYDKWLLEQIESGG